MVSVPSTSHGYNHSDCNHISTIAFVNGTTSNALYPFCFAYALWDFRVNFLKIKSMNFICLACHHTYMYFVDLHIHVYVFVWQGGGV